jgi:hypothetical protein
MNHYQQLIADEILSVHGQKSYCLSVMSVGGMEASSRKNTAHLSSSTTKS